MGLGDDLGLVMDKILDKLPFINRYPVTAIIREVRADGTRIRIDKARRMIDKNKNKQYYFFKDTREKSLPIDLKYITTNNIVEIVSPKPKYYFPTIAKIDKEGDVTPNNLKEIKELENRLNGIVAEAKEFESNKKEYVKVYGLDDYNKKIDELNKKYENVDKQYQEAVKKIESPEVKLKIIPENMANFHMLANQELADRTAIKEKWKEFLPIAMLGIVVISIGIGVFITFQGLEGFMAELTAASAQLATASNRLADATLQAKGINVPIPS